jgi:hypothetical protein
LAVEIEVLGGNLNYGAAYEVIVYRPRLHDKCRTVKGLIKNGEEQ